MNKSNVLVTGGSGQDASWLAEILIREGYRVYLMVRQSSTLNLWRLQHILDKVEIVEGDLTDYTSLHRLIDTIRPSQIYNLGAMSFVKASWDNPMLSLDVTAGGCLRLLECIRDIDTNIRFYQAGSSEQFGGVMNARPDGFIDETTPFHPRSPYAVAKAAAFHATVNYRESYGIYAVAGILFNHEGPRRGIEFVTRKVTDGVARIKLGMESELRLGNLEAKRDWGSAKDFCEAMYLMLQQPEPKDYVIATGEAHSIKDLCQVAFTYAGLEWKDYVKVDPKFFRPAEVEVLLGDSSKARQELGWQPKTSFEDMIKEMVDTDLQRLK
jgi:GDPmannose 4,6-dehydratase